MAATGSEAMSGKKHAKDLQRCCSKVSGATSCPRTLPGLHQTFLLLSHQVLLPRHGICHFRYIARAEAVQRWPILFPFGEGVLVEAHIAPLLAATDAADHAGLELIALGPGLLILADAAAAAAWLGGRPLQRPHSPHVLHVPPGGAIVCRAFTPYLFLCAEAIMAHARASRLVHVFLLRSWRWRGPVVPVILVAWHHLQMLLGCLLQLL
mmetsp:Transcript_68348/g.123176  ORF Transcript_68348/g.123176 Transcript_68348/m.123176 type:complete len:209 (-) Transcript_68348:318-944(-)